MSRFSKRSFLLASAFFTFTLPCFSDVYVVDSNDLPAVNYQQVNRGDVLVCNEDIEEGMEEDMEGLDEDYEKRAKLAALLQILPMGPLWAGMAAPSGERGMTLLLGAAASTIAVRRSVEDYQYNRCPSRSDDTYTSRYLISAVLAAYATWWYLDEKNKNKNKNKKMKIANR